MRLSIPTLAASVLVDGGCTGICKGPGCEDSYPAATLSAVRRLPRGESALAEVTLGRWDGREEEGARWTAKFAGSRVVLGQPDAGRVALVPDRRDFGAVSPDTEWLAPATELGASIVVVQAPDDPEGFDLWVGAPGTAQSRGAVHLLRNAHVSDGGSPADGSLTITSATPADRFGADLVRCADLDGDRVPDLAIPVPQLAAPDRWGIDLPPLAGALFLVLSGEPPETDLSEVWTRGRVYWGATPGEGAGAAVSCDRDLNDDGRIDVVVGAPWHDGTRGRIYVLSGADAPSGPLDEAAVRIVEGPTPREWFGTSLVALGVGGQPALAVGAPGANGGSGRVHLYPGAELDSLGEPRPTAIFVQDPSHEFSDHFGRTLARGRVIGGEADGLPVPDAIEDLLVGAPDFRDGSNGYDTGRIWVWSGADSASWFPGITTETADAVVTGPQPFSRLGRAMALGDPDGDGIEDLLAPTRAPSPD